MMRAPVSIILPAFNQVEYCRQCVTTLQANTPTPYKLILVDNGSTDGVPEYFDSVPGACVIHSETNRGFAGGVNLGLAQGRHTEAVRLFRDAIRRDPLSPILFNDLGTLLWSLGEKERALKQFRHAIQLDPACEEARRNLAEAEAAFPSTSA